MEGGTGVTSAVTELLGIASSVLTTVTSNSTLMVFFCAGLIFTAIAVVRKLKR